MLIAERDVTANRLQGLVADKHRLEAELAKMLEGRIDANLQRTDEFRRILEGKDRWKDQYEEACLELHSANERVAKYEAIVQKLKEELATCSSEIV